MLRQGLIFLLPSNSSWLESKRKIIFSVVWTMCGNRLFGGKTPQNIWIESYHWVSFSRLEKIANILEGWPRGNTKCCGQVQEQAWNLAKKILRWQNTALSRKITNRDNDNNIMISLHNNFLRIFPLPINATLFALFPPKTNWMYKDICPFFIVFRW